VEMDAEVLFELCLREIKKYAIKQLTGAWPVLMPNATYLWVLTVPAIWSPKSKLVMRKAAENAGLLTDKDKLLLALEPESASIFIQLKENVGHLAKGTKFVVADLGGGTADITSYEMLDDNHMREVTRASGGSWGSIMIDREYRNFLIKVFGEQAVDGFQLETPVNWTSLINAFEIFKRSYSMEEDINRIELNAGFVKYLTKNKINIREKLAATKFERKDAVFTYDDESTYQFCVNQAAAQLFFRPVVNQIVEHLKGLLKKPEMKGTQYLFLVGGMSQFSFVEESIKAGLLDLIEKGLVMVRPTRSHLTVVAGACLFGLRPDSITSRMTLRSYGCKMSEPFDTANPRHTADRKVKKGEGQFFVDGVFDPFVKVNQSVMNDQSVTRSYIPLLETQATMKLEFYETTEENNYFIAGCQHAGTITVTIPRKGKLEDRVVNVNMSFGSTEISITATNNSNEPFKTSIEFHANS